MILYILHSVRTHFRVIMLQYYFACVSVSYQWSATWFWWMLLQKWRQREYVHAIVYYILLVLFDLVFWYTWKFCCTFSLKLLYVSICEWSVPAESVTKIMKLMVNQISSHPANQPWMCWEQCSIFFSVMWALVHEVCELSSASLTMRLVAVQTASYGCVYNTYFPWVTEPKNLSVMFMS